MKDVILFYRDDCGYCDRAHRAMAELMEENPAYRDIPIRMVEETREPIDPSKLFFTPSDLTESTDEREDDSAPTMQFLTAAGDL